MSINGHPLHPAMVHFPFSFITLSYSLDLLHGLTTTISVPQISPFLASLIPADIAPAALPYLAHHLRTLGLLTAVPAILTGAQQLMAMTSGNKGWYETSATGEKQIRPKVVTALVHAASNDVVMGLSAWIWWTEGGFGGVGGAGKPGSFGDIKLVLAAVLVPLLFYAGNLGGVLTYNHGVGMSLGKAKGKSS